MKTPWAQTLAWIVAALAALLLAWAAPDEASIERWSAGHFDMPLRSNPR